MGVPQPDLLQPDFPEDVRYVWRWFAELSECRPCGFGPSLITWEGMAAWSAMRGIRMREWEIDLIKQLDRLWMESK